MHYDPELPCGFQDADIEMAQLTRAANRESRLRKRGICTHSWFQGPPGPTTNPTNVYTCHHCGKVFKTQDELMADRNKALAHEDID